MPDFAPNPLFDGVATAPEPPPPSASPQPQFKPNPLFDGPAPEAPLTEGQSKLGKRRAYESQRAETAQEFVATRVFPFASAIGNTAREIRYKRVMDQIAAGRSPSDDDIEFAARHEHLAQFKAERQKTLLGSLAEAGAGIPALMGEAMTVRAGSTALAGAERIAQLGTAGRAGLSAAESVGMPSLYAEQAAQRATQQGGEPTDLKNLAPPLAMAALQNVVLGRLQAKAATSTVPTQAGKLAYAGAIGVGEQAAVDTAAGAVDEFLPERLQTKTRYGTVGDLARGDIGKASTHATVQALTFAAFASMHGRAADPAETIGPALDSLAKKGMSKEAAAKAVNDAVEGKAEAPTEAVKQHVETVEEATRWPGDLPGRADRDKALADAQEAAKAGKSAVYVDMDIDNLKGLDKAVGSDSARNHVKDFVEIVKSELAGTGAEVKVFRHSGDPQGDEHSAVVVGADKRAVDAALRSAQGKIAEFTQAKGLADIPHSKGDRPPGVGVTAFAEPIEPGKPWKTAVSEAEAGTETLKARKVAEPEPESATVEVFRGVGAGRDPRGNTDTAGGLFYSPDQKVAQAYAGQGGTVVRDKVTFKNLLRADNWQEAKQKLGLPRETDMRGLIDAAGKAGFDGLAFKGAHGPEYIALKGHTSEAVDPLAGVPDADQKALAKQLGLTVKGLRDRADQPGVRELVAAVRGKTAEKPPESPQVSSNSSLNLAQQPAEAQKPPAQPVESGEVAPNAINATLPKAGEQPTQGPSEALIVRPERSGASAAQPGASPRHLQAAEMARKGKGVREIGKALGVSRTTAAKLVREAEGGTRADLDAQVLEEKRNRALDRIERQSGRNEENQLIPAVDPSELHNIPREAAKLVSGRERKVMSDVEAEKKHAKKIDALIKELSGGKNLDDARRAAIFAEVEKLQRAEEERTRPPRRQPPGVQEEAAQPEPAAGGPVEPAAPAAKPATGGRGKSLANLKQNAAPRSFVTELRKNGGISEESARLVGIDVEALKQHGGPSPFEDSSGRKSKRAADEVAEEFVKSGDIIPDPSEHATDALVRLINQKAPSVDALSGMGADAHFAKLEAAQYKAEQEEADARSQALRSGHSAASVEEAVRRGQADGEAEARAEAEANRTDEPSDAVPSFDPAEFGKPLTDAERRTGLGGGQENAGDAQRVLHETALANARVDAERVKNGLPPLMAAARRANPEVWDQAMAKLGADPNVSARLVEELAAAPRATTVDENALLLHRKIALNNEYERTMRQGSAAWRAKNLPEFDRLSGRADELLGQIDRLDKVTRSTGTEWGRAGQFRRQLALEDFSLSRMMLEAERAKREPLTAEEKADIAKMAERIKELEGQLAALKEKGGKTPDGRDETDVEIEIDKQKQRHRERIEDFNRKHRPLHQKVIAGGLETANVVRTFITAYDLSAVLRQGAMLTYAHPVKAARAVPGMLKSFLDSHHFDRAEKLIRNRPNGALYEKAGLYLSDQLSHPEEAFLGRWVKKIPGVAASERAYSSFLNRMRADVFDSLVAALPRDGKPNPAEAKALANYVNVSTGRGKLPGGFEKAADTLAQVFFSPRYLASRFQVLAGQPFYGGTARTRKLVAQEYARSLAGLGVFYAVAKALMPDSELDFDPRSSDFGKLKMGRFRVDPLAGFSQLVTFGARLTSGETKSTETGRVSALRGPKHEFGDTSTGDVVVRFLRSKLAPVPGSVYDVLSGTMPGGQPTTKERLAGQFIPISIRDVYEAMTSDQGVPRGVALSLLAILGMGTQNYEVRDKKTSKQEPVLPAFPSKDVQPRRKLAGAR